MLAFSTRWNSLKNTDGELMLAQIRKLGFGPVEISEGLKVSLLPGIKRKFTAGDLEVTSVQNFNPAPIEAANGAAFQHQLSSLGSGRRRAVQLTQQTIDLAKELKAPVVIVKLGTTSLKEVTDNLVRLAKNGRINSREYVRLKLDAVKQREAISDKYMSRIYQSLDEVLEYAAQNEVKIAVENASHYEHLPTERELRALLEKYKTNPWLGYWHNFGHCQMKSNLGLLDHEDWLQEVSPHILGCHVQDVQWPAELQQVPFSGSVDFAQLMRYIPEEAPLVWDLGPKQKPADIQQALPTWEEKLGTQATATATTV